MNEKIKVNENEKQIINICDKNNSIVTYKDCKKLNIDKNYLKRLVKKGLLHKIVDGVYSNNKNTLFDEMWYLQYKNKDIIFDRISAANIINQTNYMIHKYDVVIPRNRKVNNKKTKVYYEPNETINIGAEYFINSHGNKVKAYCFERIIANIIKRNEESEFSEELIKNYINYENKDIPKLKSICKQLNISKERIYKLGIR